MAKISIDLLYFDDYKENSSYYYSEKTIFYCPYP